MMPEKWLAAREGSQFRGSGVPAASPSVHLNDVRFNPWRKPAPPHLSPMTPWEMSLALLLASRFIGQDRGWRDFRDNGPRTAQRQPLWFIRTHYALPCVYASLRPTLMV